MGIVYINGSFVAADQAMVSVLDRGFIFGDGVYEVIPVYGSHVLRLDEHLQRLQRSLDGIFISNPMPEAEWRRLITELLHRNPGAENRSVYLQVTRGTGPREHVGGDDLVPTVFAMCNPIPERVYDEGISAISHEDIRWQYCHIKATSLLPSILLKEKARRMDGSTEALLVRGGVVTEGASSNVFVVRAGCIRTPPKSNFLLPGVTRDLLVELLQDAGLDCREEAIRDQDLRTADEIWISSSTLGVAPVVRLDGKPVGGGRPGELWLQADRLYQEFKQRPRVIGAAADLSAAG